MACAANESARPSQKNQCAMPLFRIVGVFRLTVPTPRAVGRLSVKNLSGWWQVAHETFPFADRRVSKNIFFPNEARRSCRDPGMGVTGSGRTIDAMVALSSLSPNALRVGGLGSRSPMRVMKKAAMIPVARMSRNIAPVKGLFLDVSLDFFLRKGLREFISFMVLLSGVSTA